MLTPYTHNHVIISDGYQFETAVATTAVVVPFLFLSRAITPDRISTRRGSRRSSFRNTIKAPEAREIHPLRRGSNAAREKGVDVAAFVGCETGGERGGEQMVQRQEWLTRVFSTP